MIRTSAQPAVALGLVALFGGCALACQGCKEDHPYVPYTIGGEEAAAPTAASSHSSAPLEEEASAPFTQLGATGAPPGSKSWTLDGLKLEAPPGTVFVLGLTGDLSGDGSVDALAIVRGSGSNVEPPAADGGKAAAVQAELVFYKGHAGGALDPGVVVGAPPALLLDPTCSPVERLSKVGKHSVFVELGAQCAGHAVARAAATPSRWAAVVSVGRAATVHFSVLVADPPGAPALTLDADGTDYDGDGIDDVALRVTLEGGSAPFEPGPRVSAIVRWIDRPAGMSRAPDQPETSFHALASVAASHAGKAKEAPTVPPYVQQVRALYAAICSEGGAPRLLRAVDGGPIACGTTSRALEEAGLAEVRALVTMGDVLGAIAALDRAQQAPAAHTAARTTEAQGWIAQAAPFVPATSLRAIGAVPLIDHGRSPSWGAMMFEPTGKLLVRTLAQVVRVDPAMGDEAEASDVPAWKAAVMSPDGSLRWNDVVDPCDASALRATFSGDGDLREVSIPLHGRLAARCGPKGEPVPATPTAWGQGGLEAIVLGQPVAFALDLSHATVLPSSPTQPTIPGAPRSPDGKTLVVPTSIGIVVRGARTRIYRAKELDGAYLELRDCTVSDDATRVACVRGGRAFVGIW
jgi:hypothetical protein